MKVGVTLFFKTTPYFILFIKEGVKLWVICNKIEALTNQSQKIIRHATSFLNEDNSVLLMAWQLSVQLILCLQVMERLAKILATHFQIKLFWNFKGFTRSEWYLIWSLSWTVLQIKKEMEEQRKPRFKTK